MTYRKCRFRRWPERNGGRAPQTTSDEMDTKCKFGTHFDDAIKKNDETKILCSYSFTVSNIL
jgi:hypothetical protein